MAFHSLLENLQAEFNDARCDEAPGKVPSIVPAGSGLSGNAVEFFLRGRKNQQTVHVYKELSPALRGTIYVASKFQFQKDMDWTTPRGIDSYANEHKLFIIDTADGIGRILINLRGGGNSPVLAIHTERTDPYLWKDTENQHAYGPGSGVSNWSDAHWPTDGQWHDVEAEIERTGGDNDRVRIWLDGKIVMDIRGRTCGATPSSVTSVKVGAFFNGAPPADTRFKITDIRQDVSRGATPPGVIPPVVTPPAATIDWTAILRDLDDLVRRESLDANDLLTLQTSISQSVAAAASLYQRTSDTRNDLQALVTRIRNLQPK